MLKQLEVADNDGVTVQCEVEPQKLRKIRLINFVEPFIVYGLILAVMWISELDEDLIWMWIAFGILLLWVLLISPWWHYFKLNEKDIFLRPEQQNFWFWIFECRGLGSVKKYFKRDETGKRGFVRHWDAILKMTILWNILFLCAPYAFESDFNDIITDIFGDASTLTRIGVTLVALVVIDVALIFILYPLMLRLDNFIDGWNKDLRFLTIIGIPLVIIFNLIFQIFWADLQGLPEGFTMVGDPPLFSARPV